MVSSTRFLYTLVALVTCFHDGDAFVPHGASLPETTTTTKRSLPKRNWVAPSSSASTRISSTQLQMASPAGMAAAAIGAITGGFCAGGLHAVAGPDHLAALLPKCVGQRWYHSGRIGALWGMGHGISATLLGVAAFFLKSRVVSVGFTKFLHKVSSFTEVCVGFSLVLIGLMGIKEAREWAKENPIPTNSLSAAVLDNKEQQKNRVVILNGLLHGFSWDGAPSLAPSLAVATWRGNLAFLLAYALGTIGVMTVATTVIGEGSRQAGHALHRHDLPQKLGLISSAVAIVIGTVFCGMAIA